MPSIVLGAKDRVALSDARSGEERWTVNDEKMYIVCRMVVCIIKKNKAEKKGIGSGCNFKLGDQERPTESVIHEQRADGARVPVELQGRSFPLRQQGKDLSWELVVNRMNVPHLI